MQRRTFSTHAASWTLLFTYLTMTFQGGVAHAMPAAAHGAAPLHAPASAPTVTGNRKGQASTSFVFDLPPATLQPRLSLQYSSDGGDSDVGYGWTLEGPSFIERDTARRAPSLDVLDDDYTADGVILHRSDATATRFTAFGDVSMADYRFDASANQWLVSTHDGRVRTYTPSIMQRSVANDAPTPLWRRSGVKDPDTRTPADRTVVWALTKEEDAFGNTIEYHYETTPSYGHNRPMLVEIRYGGNPRLNLAPPIIVSLGRYLHPAPPLIASYEPEHASSGQCTDVSRTVSDDLDSGRYGGMVSVGNGERIWGIGVSIADGATTDPASFSRATSLVSYWRIRYNFDSIGCQSVRQLHAVPVSIEPFGIDATTGQALAAPATTYEYNDWERRFTMRTLTLPWAVPSAIPSAPGLTPSLQTLMPTLPGILTARGIYPSGPNGADVYRGAHWPQTIGYDTSTGEQLEQNPADPDTRTGGIDFIDTTAPGVAQMLSDENGDGLPDFADLLSTHFCNSRATGGRPVYWPMAANGSGFLSTPLSITSAFLFMNSRLPVESASPEGRCAFDLWRPILATAYRRSGDPPLGMGQQINFLSISGQEIMHVDLDGNGYPDLLRMIGTTRLFSSSLLDAANTVGNLQYALQAPDGTYAPLRALIPPPWAGAAGSDARFIAMPNHNVSATVNNADSSRSGEGYDWSSSELGSLIDLTGDGVPDRLAALRSPGLSNYVTSPDRAVLALYRGVYARNTSGQRELQFRAAPEYWWTRSLAVADGQSDVVQPATSAHVRTKCYGPRAETCTERDYGLSTTIDVNGDGLLDLVYAEPKLEGNYSQIDSGPRLLNGGGGFTLAPVKILYNRGRAFDTAPPQGVWPSLLSYATRSPFAAADGGRIEEQVARLVDFNGDGYPDFVERNAVRFGRGDGLTPPMAVPMPGTRTFADRSLVVSLDYNDAIAAKQLLVDMNGDGRPDVLSVVPGTSGQAELYTDADMTAAPGRLRKISNGLGAEVSFTYQTIAKALENDARGVPYKGWVLASSAVTKGSLPHSGPANQTTTYRYRNGQFGPHPGWRDDGSPIRVGSTFLGFGEVEVVSPTGQRHVSRYEYTPARPGVLVEDSTFSARGDRMSQALYTYRDVATHPRPGALAGDPTTNVTLLESETRLVYHQDGSTYVATPTRSVTRYDYPTPPLQYDGAPARIRYDRDPVDVLDDTRDEKTYVLAEVTVDNKVFRRLLQSESRTYSVSSSGIVDRVESHTRVDYDCNPDGVDCGSARPTYGLASRQIVFTDRSAPNDISRALVTTRYFTEGRLVRSKDTFGFETSYCYDPRRLYITKVRQPSGMKRETVSDLATGHAIEVRGPVGFDARPLGDGGDPCPTISKTQPRFGGKLPILPAVAKANGEVSPLATDSLDTAPPAWSYRTPAGTGTPPPPPQQPPPYSYTPQKIAAALNDRRLSALIVTTNPRSYLQQPWIFTATPTTREPVSTDWSPPTVPAPGARRLTNNTERFVEDGLGRVIQGWRTYTRDASGAFLETQVAESSFADNAIGHYEITSALMAGQHWNAADAKRNWHSELSDGVGQWLMTTRVVSQSDYATEFAMYDATGAPTVTYGPDPAAVGGWVARTNIDFDDRNQPRGVVHSAGRSSYVKRGFRIGDGPELTTQFSIGEADPRSGTRMRDVTYSPRLRRQVSRTYLTPAAMGNQSIETTEHYDAYGRTDYVVNPEGQVTSYEYDLAGRTTREARFNQFADYLANRPLEYVEHLLPSASAGTGPLVYTKRSHAFDAARVETIADESIEVNRSTGRVDRVMRPAISTGVSLPDAGAITFLYVTNPMQDGYGQVSAVTSATEQRAIGYDAMQLPSQVDRRMLVAWPGGGANLADTIQYRFEHSASGRLARQTIVVPSAPEIAPQITRYEYDYAGHVAALFDETLSSTREVARLVYNHTGDLASLTLPGELTKTLTYDHFGALATMTVAGADGTTQFQQTLARDPRSGVVTGINTARPSGTIATGYKHNLAGQLTEATESGPGGNYGLAITYRCSGTICDERFDVVSETTPGQPTRSDRYEYASHDVDQLAAIVTPTTRSPVAHDGTGARSRSLDGRTTRNDLGGRAREHETGGYLYDADGNQVGQFVRTASGALPDRVLLSLPDLELEYTREATGVMRRALVRRYVGPVRRALAGTLERSTITADVLGNVAMVRTGTNVAWASYTPFGELMAARSANFDREWRGWKGGMRDLTGTGFYRFGARHYDPRTRVWTSRDPARMQLPNASAYTAFGNSPVLFDDPTGLQSQANQSSSAAPDRDRPPQPDAGFYGEFLRRYADPLVRMNVQRRTADAVKAWQSIGYQWAREQDERAGDYAIPGLNPGALPGLQAWQRDAVRFGTEKFYAEHVMQYAALGIANDINDALLPGLASPRHPHHADRALAATVQAVRGAPPHATPHVTPPVSAPPVHAPAVHAPPTVHAAPTPLVNRAVAAAADVTDEEIAHTNAAARPPYGGGGRNRGGDDGDGGGRRRGPPASRRRDVPADDLRPGEGRSRDGSADRHAGGVQGQVRGRDALRAGNREIDRVTRELDLTPDMRQRLHNDVHRENLPYEEMLERAYELFPHLRPDADP